MISAYKNMRQGTTRTAGALSAPDSDFAAFFEQFMRGEIAFTSWFRHVADWWKNRDHLDVLFVRYEDMKQDLEASVRRIAEFCGFEIPPEKMPRILERCSFAYMKQHADKFTPQPPLITTLHAAQGMAVPAQGMSVPAPGMQFDAAQGMAIPLLGMEFDSGHGTPVPYMGDLAGMQGMPFTNGPAMPAAPEGMQFDSGPGMMPAPPAQATPNTPVGWWAGGDAPAAFFRKGIVGDWQEYFTAEQLERYKKAYAKYLGSTGLYTMDPEP